MLRQNLFSLFILLAVVVHGQQTSTVSVDSLQKKVDHLENDITKMKKLVVSGWIQSQFQYIETRGAANFDGGTFATNSDKRFMIRRGRVKFTYNGKNSQYVMQINGTERGLNLVEIFGVLSDPHVKSFSLTVGIMNRPFGFEIDQSSAVRESPERSRYTQILMPNERDLGAKIIFAPGKGHKLNGLRLDAGLYNGQGIYVPGTTSPAGYAANTTPVLGVNEVDFQKDFIGRLQYYKELNSKIKVGIGASHYNGGNLFQTNIDYDNIQTNANGVSDWVAHDTSSTVLKNKKAPRVYTGVEGYFRLATKAGSTTVRGEYIQGTQTGSAGSSASPTFPTATSAMYVRNFSAAYGYFIHRYKKHEAVLKVEYYDPNVKVKGSNIIGGSTNKFSAADIRYEQIGFGYNYYLNENIVWMFHYTIQRNEATGLAGYTKDLKDNVLTVRMQYRF